MKQLVQDLRSGEMRIEEVPQPAPSEGRLLVRTAVSLVSVGTERMVVEFARKSLAGKARSRPDLVKQVLEKARQEGLVSTAQKALNRIDQPMALGYSSAGTVVAVGPGVEGVRTGQRVACSGGGYAVHAEYALVPVNLITPIPDEVEFETAAFTTLAAIALHGFRLAEVQVGARVAVIGLGLLGLLSVEIAKAAGCSVFGIDLDTKRVKLAEAKGAKAVGRKGAEAAAGAFTGGSGFDAVLICADATSNDPVELAAEVARDRGSVIAVGAVGMEIPRGKYFQKELRFRVSRSYGPGRYDPAYEEKGQDYPAGFVRWTEGRNFEAVVDLMASGKLNPSNLVTHRFAIDEAPKAYDLITSQDEEFLGVLLHYPESEDAAEKGKKKTILDPKRDGTVSDGKVRLGVLGAGNFAANVLLPAMKGLAGLDMVGIATPSGLRAKQAARRFGFGYATSEEEEILKDPAINTVAILTPHNQHADQVIAALAAGKHVFCEKPLAISSEQLAAVESAMAEHPEQLLMVGFNRRFAPLSQELKRFLAGRSEAIMAHYRVNAGYLPLEHWLHDADVGGGRLVGEACHFIDYAAFLVGAPPVSVTAKGLPDGGRYQDDNVALGLSFDDGSLVTITYTANGDASLEKERLEVFSEGRAAVLDDFRNLTLHANGRARTIKSRFKQDKGHRGEWVAFIQAIRGENSAPIPYQELLGVSNAALGSVRALRNDMVVEVA
ncbi:MAG: bi-domain-containing oxidoreductase [Anaerolineae bacterium]|nr:bi-domain-containing oxidoreductase [Anaerolineae bacterium]